MWGNREDSEALFCRVFPFGMLLCHSVGRQATEGITELPDLWQTMFLSAPCFVHSVSQGPAKTPACSPVSMSVWADSRENAGTRIDCLYGLLVIGEGGMVFK